MTALLYGLGAFLLYTLGIAAYQFAMAIVGKWAGARIEVVSIGAGPKLFSLKIGEWEVRLSALPYGGYTKFKGDDPDDPDADPVGSFNRVPVICRLATFVSGPLALAIIGLACLALPVLAGADQLGVVGPDQSALRPSAVPGLGIRPEPASFESQFHLTCRTGLEFVWRTVTFQSLEGWGGPLGFFVTAGAIGKVSVGSWLSAVGVVMVTIALGNLLPIPAFNGFLILCAAFEGITARRVSDRVIIPANYVGILIMLSLFVRVVLVDLYWLLGLMGKGG